MTDKEALMQVAHALGFRRAEIEQPFDKMSYLRARKVLRDLFRVASQAIDINEKDEQEQHDS
jgi:hypothetical protein